MPNHEGLAIQLPGKCVYAFLEEEIEAFALDHQGKKIAEFISATKGYSVYLISYKGQDICLAQAPVSSAPAAQFMDWLIWLWCYKNHQYRNLWCLNTYRRKPFFSANQGFAR